MKRALVRVLVADDSPLCVDVLRTVIEADSRMAVVGVAHDGLRAVELARTLRPTIVTMDVHMPKLDGLAAIDRIVHEHPTTRILVVTSDTGATSGMRAFEALRRGAADLVCKPQRGSGEAAAFCARLWNLVRRVSSARAAPAPAASRPSFGEGGETHAIGIVASTGGPAALAKILSALPRDFESAVLVVQHMTPGFAPRLAEWLARVSPLDVRLARDGDLVVPGRVLIAPDQAHMTVDFNKRLRLDDGAAIDGHRPSGTRLLRSLAQVWGSRAAGVILTGMGKDGVDGLATLRRAGGRTAAQDELSSAVYGMPRMAFESEAAERSLSLDAMSEYLRHLATRRFVEAR